MFADELGLLRDLFKNIVGNRIPSLIGPENSAFFYHLLGIEQIPEQSSHLFEVHWTTKESGMGPKFVEEYRNFTADYLSHPEKSTSSVFENAATQKKTIIDESKMFLADIGGYFGTKKDRKTRGVAT